MPAGWSVTDGVLHKESQISDIVTTDQFGDFELDLDWQIGPGGNSGISIGRPRSTIACTGAVLSISSSTTHSLRTVGAV